MYERLRRTLDELGRPLVETDSDLIRIEFGDPDCARNLKRLIEAAISTLSPRSKDAIVSRFLLYTAWLESGEGARRIAEGGRFSLFGITAADALATFRAASPLEREVLIATGELSDDFRKVSRVKPADGSRPDQRLEKQFIRRLTRPSFDLFAAQLAILRARSLSLDLPPVEEAAPSGGLEDRYLSYAKAWLRSWRPESSSPTETPSNASSGEDAVQLGRFLAEAWEVDRAAASPSSDGSQPSDPKKASSWVETKLRELVAKRPILTTLAAPTLFSVVFPLFLKWFGGTDTDENVPAHFASAIRGFALLYFALPPLFVIAFITDALSVLALGGIAMLFLIVVFVNTSAAALWYASAVSVAALAVWSILESYRVPAWVPASERTTRRVVSGAALLSFAVAYLAVIRHDPGEYQATFATRMRATRVAANIVRAVDSLDVWRRDAVLRANGHLDGLLLASVAIDSGASTQAANARRAFDANLSHANALASAAAMGADSISKAVRSARGLVDTLKERENRLAVLLEATPTSSSQPARVLNGEAAARLDSVRRVEQRRLDSTRASEAQVREAAHTALRLKATNLFNAVRRSTQIAWGTELGALRAWGLGAFCVLLVTVAVLISRTTGARRLRATVLAAAVFAIMVPVVRPIYDDEIDPLHPFAAFSFPSASIASLTSAALPGHHDITADTLFTPTTSHGGLVVLSNDSTTVRLLRQLDSLARTTIDSVGQVLKTSRETARRVGPPQQ